MAGLLNMSTTLNNTDNGSTLSPADYYYYYQTDFHDIQIRAEYFLSQPYYIIALVLSMAAIFANVTSLAAIYQIRKVMNSHFRILVSLIASDLLVDISAVAHIVNSIIHPLLAPGSGEWNERLASRCTYMAIKALNTTGLNITLLNLMAMAIDHYIAILRPFKLHSLLNRRRTILMIVIMWVIAFLSGFSDFFSPLQTMSTDNSNTSYLNFCELVWVSAYQEEYTTFAIVIIGFISMLYMYLLIYCEVKGKTLDDTYDCKSHRNKRALVTTLLILGTFIFCWLPICIFSVVLIIITKVSVSPEILQFAYPILEQVDKYLYDLMLLNTLLDPIIYAIRMNEVRRGYRLLLSHCIPNKSKLFYKLRRQSIAGGFLDNSMVTNDAGRKSMTEVESIRLSLTAMTATTAAIIIPSQQPSTTELQPLSTGNGYDSL